MWEDCGIVGSELLTGLPRACEHASAGVRRMQMKRHDDSQRGGRLAPQNRRPRRRPEGPRSGWPIPPIRSDLVGEADKLPAVTQPVHPMPPYRPPVPPNTHFSSCRSITARTVRPVRDPAYAVAFTSAVAIGGAGSVHRRTGMRTARALPGDRNRPGSPPATDCRQDPPPALPAIQTRCFANHHPMVAHRPTWPCDAGPDVRRPVGAFMMGGARAARSTPHNTASTQTRPYRKHPAGACRRTGGAK